MTTAVYFLEAFLAGFVLTGIIQNRRRRRR